MISIQIIIYQRKARNNRSYIRNLLPSHLLLYLLWTFTSRHYYKIATLGI